MKKQITLTIIAIVCSLTSIAQKPFKEIGKDNEVKMVTLSNGQFMEFFNYDTLRQIGTVIFNTNTQKVQYFIPENDTIMAYLEKLNENLLTSRFMSIDPLARQFPFYTPYQFAGNSPIAAIDMDGMESFIATKNFKNNEIALILLNAEDLLSVTWSDIDKETKTDPLMISEVSKFIYNVKVDKNTGEITFPESDITKAYTFQYQKFEKNADGISKKDENGNYIPDSKQGIGTKNPMAHTGIVKSIEVGDGFLATCSDSDEDLISRVDFGFYPKVGFDRMDIFVKEELRGAVINKLKSLDSEFDESKIKWLDKPNGDPNTVFDIDYVRTIKSVDEIE